MTSPKAYSYIRSQGALVAPAGLPEEIREKLEKTLSKIVKNCPNVDVLLKRLMLYKEFKSGEELYKEVMAMYEENKKILPEIFGAPR